MCNVFRLEYKKPSSGKVRVPNIIFKQFITVVSHINIYSLQQHRQHTTKSKMWLQVSACRHETITRPIVFKSSQ